MARNVFSLAIAGDRILVGAQIGASGGGLVLEEELRREQSYTDGLIKEWDATVQRLSTFRESSTCSGGM